MGGRGCVGRAGQGLQLSLRSLERAGQALEVGVGVGGVVPNVDVSIVAIVVVVGPVLRIVVIIVVPIALSILSVMG